jgi:hypothetical protein
MVECTKIGADSLVENTPNAPEFICPMPMIPTFANLQKNKFYCSFSMIFIVFLSYTDLKNCGHVNLP